MWAVPTLDQMNENNLPGFMKKNNIWFLLLFQKSNTEIANKIREDWDLYHTALGIDNHLVTLLNEDQTFPLEYDQKIGSFCKKLGVDVNKLPALVLINKTDDNGNIIYFPLGHAQSAFNEKIIPEMIGNICKSSRLVPADINEKEWDRLVIKNLKKSFAFISIKSFIVNNKKDLIDICVKLIGALK